MSSPSTAPALPSRSWAADRLFLGMSFWDYMKSLATPGNFLVGLVAGHFTLAEWAVFQQNESELTRRTVGLIVQRLQDLVVGREASLEFAAQPPGPKP